MRSNRLFFKGVFLFMLLASGGPLGAPPPRPVIVVDPGHGGRDPGTIGRKKKLKEKDVVLRISKKLTGALEKETGGRVYLTRTRDAFLDLERRNHLANWRKCDVFLSLHANASEDRRTEGVEIYYLNRATDNASRRLAARENRGISKRREPADAILSDLLQAAVTEESAELASSVKRSLKREAGLKDVAVKTALFYVLVGAKCPSLLIEIGFLTNREEEKRLGTASYQKTLAGAIAKGVSRYLKGRSRVTDDL